MSSMGRLKTLNLLLRAILAESWGVGEAEPLLPIEFCFFWFFDAGGERDMVMIDAAALWRMRFPARQRVEDIRQDLTER